MKRLQRLVRQTSATLRPGVDVFDAEDALGVALLTARQKAGLTQQQVADAMGTTQTAIARMESGRFPPSTRTLQRFAEATNTRLFLGFIERPKQKANTPMTLSPDPRTPEPFLRWLTSRRSLLGMATGLAASALALSHVSGQDGSPSSSPNADTPPNGVQPDGSWVFTDDRGNTISLPQPPRRIVATLSAAAPLWDFGIRPAAIAAESDPGSPPWGNVDPTTLNISTGPGDGLRIDLEQLVALEADLFVNVTWSPQSDDGSDNPIREVIPVVAISMTGSLADNISRFGELAGLLGADLETSEISAAREAYEGAIEELREVLIQKSDLSVLFAYAADGAGSWYAARYEDWADLAFYQSLGVGITEVEGSEGSFWENLSYEQVTRYPTDVFLNSTRDGMMTADQLQAHPTFGEHPAIKAGQIGGWNQDFIQSFQGITPAIIDLTATLRSSSKVT